MFQLTINTKWCKGCALCVDYCPKKVLDIGSIGDIPMFTRSTDCIGCNRCTRICPERAITLSKNEKEV